MWKGCCGLHLSGSHAHSQKDDVNLKEDTKLKHGLARGGPDSQLRKSSRRRHGGREL